MLYTYILSTTSCYMIFSRGVRYMLLASFLFSMMNVCVKYVSHIPPVEIILFRSIVSFVVSFWTLKRLGIPVLGTRKGLLIARGVFGITSLILLFTTLHHLPLAHAVLLHYLAPIFTAIIVSVVLKEYIYPVQWLFFLLSFAGIALIKGVDTRMETLYFGMGVVAAFLSGCAYTCIRKLKDSEHPLVIVLYFPMIALPVAGVASVFGWVTPQGWDWLLLLAIGLLTQFAQEYMTRAYQAEEAARVASVNYLGIVYALSFGWLFFDEHINLLVLAGIGMVLAGVMLNISVKQWMGQKKSGA